MNENILNIKIKRVDDRIEEIDNTDGNLDINCDFCSRAIWINRYMKKGPNGQIHSRIILFEQIKELEIIK